MFLLLGPTLYQRQYDWGEVVADHAIGVPPKQTFAGQIIWIKSLDRINYNMIHVGGKVNTAKAHEVFSMFFDLMESIGQLEEKFTLRDYISKLGLDK